MRTNSRSLEESGLDSEFDMTRVLARVRVPSRVPNQKPSLVVDNEPSDQKWPLPGFAPMTRITTSFGAVHAAALRKGDLVRTSNNEFKPIEWLDRVILDEHFLSGLPDANPIRIPADSFGRGLPKVDVMVSPRQLIGQNPRVSLTPGTEAADLLSRPGIFRQPETGLSYTMFHLGEPAEVICEGLVVRVEP